MSVSTMRARLSARDIERLVRADDAEERAMSAHKICRRIAAGGLGEADRVAARQIIDLILNDAAATVRRALAVTLKASPDLPREAALRLIADIDSIAAPILEHSPSLTDADLSAVILAGPSARQVCVARRAAISPAVTRIIADLGCEQAVATAAANDGAVFDRGSYLGALRRFGGAASVTDGFIARAHVPVEIAEAMVSLVSDAALKRLAARHELPPQLAVELAEGARERATIDLIDQAELSSDLHRFVQQLHLNGRLTPSLIVRGVCAGATGFFEHAMAELAGVAHRKAWVLIHDAGPLGLRALFDRTGLPERVFPALRVAVDVCHDTERSGEALSRREFSQRVTQRILTRRQGFAPADLDYLLARLDVDAHAPDPDAQAVLRAA